MTSMTIILGDKNPDLIDAWIRVFGDLVEVEVRGGNLLLTRADALVSPANSFGFMDGGFDWSISELFDWKIQSVVQEAIKRKHDGELLVGFAEIVATGHDRFPYLVCAPTMRVPQDVSDSVNAFLAMRAILRAVERFNKANGDEIRSIAIPGLATGVGKMPFDRCAYQMRAAYDLFKRGASNSFRSLSEAIAEEKRMKGK